MPTGYVCEPEDELDEQPSKLVIIPPLPTTMKQYKQHARDSSKTEDHKGPDGNPRNPIEWVRENFGKQTLEGELGIQSMLQSLFKGKLPLTTSLGKMLSTKDYAG